MYVYLLFYIPTNGYISLYINLKFFNIKRE